MRKSVHYTIKSMADFDIVESMIGKKKMVLLVHADWCGHCKVLVDAEEGKTSVWDRVKANNKSIVMIDFESKIADHILKEKKESMLANVMLKSLKGYPFIAKVEKTDVASNTLSVIVYNNPMRTVDALTKFSKL